jgi:hypothetical protein
MVSLIIGYLGHYGSVDVSRAYASSRQISGTWTLWDPKAFIGHNGLDDHKLTAYVG